MREPNNENINQAFSIFTLFAMLMLAFITPAMAFDGRSGQRPPLKANEVVNDDLYVAPRPSPPMEQSKAMYWLLDRPSPSTEL
ncbi:MAG: hypothetical protein U0Z26_02870 [Anaerolineales bacterium]